MRLRAVCAVTFLYFQYVVLTPPESRDLLFTEGRPTLQNALWRKCDDIDDDDDDLVVSVKNTQIQRFVQNYSPEIYNILIVTKTNQDILETNESIGSYNPFLILSEKSTLTTVKCPKKKKILYNFLEFFKKNSSQKWKKLLPRYITIKVKRTTDQMVNYFKKLRSDDALDEFEDQSSAPILAKKRSENCELHEPFVVFRERMKSADSRPIVKKSEEGYDMATVPWQALWLLQSPSEECGVQVQEAVLRLEKAQRLLPTPHQPLGRCPVRFRPHADPHRWFPRNLVEAECVCEGSPCGKLGTHICVTVYSIRHVLSLQHGRRRVLLAVGCLCVVQHHRLTKMTVPQSVV